MKKFSISVLLIMFSCMLYAQTKSVNCIIFVDGKLIRYGAITGYFSYKDSIQQEKRIDFDYEIGDLLLSHENNSFVSSLNPDDDITINLTYKVNNGPRFNYSGVLKVGWLNYRYLVIRITNLNKSKGTYYFAYSGPGGIKPFIKQEYNMFEEYKDPK